MTLRNPVSLHRDPAATLALQALAFIMGNTPLRERFVDLSGVTPDDLRHGLDTDSVLAAVIGFLAAHEPDLLACAASLGIPAEQLMNAAYVLQGGHE
jgi:Protein of unknown function (DUF3572)